MPIIALLNKVNTGIVFCNTIKSTQYLYWSKACIPT